jgi:restriction endonuclease S subunit
MSKIDIIRKFAEQIANMEGMEIGSPIVLEEISFVPIIKQEVPIEERDYLSLSEALEKGVCKIIDKGTEVAHILFQNLGNLPILIEEG